MRDRARFTTATLSLLILAGTAVAGEAPEGKQDRPKPEAEMWQERVVETRHSVRIGGQAVAYRATAGTLLLKEEDATPKASVFYVAYTREGVEDPAERPVTFAFNGGPGSSSVWLHLGAFGPRRVLFGPEGEALPPPPRLVDNEHSLLDLTDLVFIDPVTTGYSRAVPEEDPGQFHGVQQDIESVAEVIRLWTTRAGRWGSPKFLAGESYGTTRAAGLAGWLQQRHGMYVNGIVLVSAVLDFQTIRFHATNELPYLLFLPSYTATARYHQRLSPELQERPLEDLLAEVADFARTDYALALLAGARLDEAERDRIAERLAAYTGLSRSLIDQWELRIDAWAFFEELLRDRGEVVGRLDSRYHSPRQLPGGAGGFYSEPSYDAILGAYSAALNAYVRGELDFESELPYEVLTGRVHPWSFEGFEGRYVDVASTLRQAIVQNPFLRVFVANGYYDLATPYLATLHTFDHLRLPVEVRGNVAMGFYQAGHMMYVREADLAKLKADLATFFRQATP